MGNALEGLAAAQQYVARPFIRRADDLFHFLVDADGSVFGIIAVLGDFAAQEDGFLFLAVGKRPQFAHAPLADHVASDLGGALDIVAGSGSEMTEKNFLGAATTHQHGKHALKIALGIGMFVVDGQLHGDAQGHAARDDGHLVKRVGTGSHRGHQGVAGLVISGVSLLLLGEDHGLAFDAHQHLVLGHLKIGHGDELAVLPRRPQRCLVHQVRHVGAGETRCAARQDREVHFFAERDLARVHAQDLLAAFDVRPRHHHAPVEPARPQQRWVEHVRTIGGGNQDDTFVGLEAVHLH